MRCFFHLVSDFDAILDDTGIEVPDLETAKFEAMKAIRELRQELVGASEEWRGWRLDIVCPQGTLLYSFDLNTPPH
ncbi:DUF6894 family protein [Microvirga lenta]|uniref:DUF6894 family protein n=1 Tax=Microvirga lenta TaxID=2881337 RepID=UPI001CFFA905|nr:hypothetical protein [Microvirga lenta]MCB5176627.1 hypothetical protein [Microvirga lenta]